MSSTTEPNTFKQGRYEVQEVLGRGPYSSVYKVYDTEGDKSYALKVLGLANHDRDIAEAMFNKEVDALSGFKHDGVVQLVDRFTERKTGALCIVLELIPRAVTLQHVIAEVSKGQREPLSLVWRLEQLEQLITVLDHAHNRNIIHRDVKPGNILVGQRGGNTFTKLADFGIARILEHYGREKSVTLPQFATAPYAPPEQVKSLETNVASDYYAFGVTMLALLTWQLPKQSLEGKTLEDAIVQLKNVFADSESQRVVERLVRDLLSTEPSKRPRPLTVKRTLQNLLNRLTTKPRVGLVVTQSVRDKLEDLGISVYKFFEDLNDYPVAEYQENVHDGQKKVNVVFYGQSFTAVTVTDRYNPEQLVIVDIRTYQPEFHSRQRESDTVNICPYELVEGPHSAYNLLNEFYEHFRRNQLARQHYENKRDLLKSSLFILSRLEDNATDLIVNYRQQEIQKYDDILKINVVSVVSSDDDGVEILEAVNDEVINDWIGNLDDSTSFALQLSGRRGPVPIGVLRNYNPYTRELSLRLTSQRPVPPQGTLVCQNVAQLASNRRQRIAVDRFLADNTINSRLGELLLKPGTNTIGERKPRTLFQPLEPPQDAQSIVERALAAQDFFLIQGPPGTGKTTLIAEIVLQILREKPEARILLTAQANPAVDNALDKIRELAEEHAQNISTLRLTRTQLQNDVNEFDDSFGKWVLETRAASEVGLQSILPQLKPEVRDQVKATVENWRNKLDWAEDVRRDYAQSVQVYGVTCLRAPTLWELLRKVEFDWVVVDEAAKATDTELLVPLVHGRRFIMVGDQKQLPPYVDTEIMREMRTQGISEREIQTSLFEKIFELIPESNKTVLRRQYRMHHTIGDFVGRLFYSDVGGLETGVSNDERQISIDYLKRYEHRVIWFDVASGEERKEPDGNSFYNRSEAIKINTILELFNKNLAVKDTSYVVGVITPYAAQVEVLKEQIVPAAKMWTHLKIEVSTVDAFQGRQNDITVYSMVRTRAGSLRFVEDEKRLNVSFSRAKRALLIFGHRDTAMTSSTFSRALKLIPKDNIITGG